MAASTIPVGAQDGVAPTESAIAPYDPANFHNGEAQSSGNTFRFNITQGEADIGFSYGSVLATYRDKTGKADSRALDLGVFPTLFGVQQCDGSPPLLNPATFPPKTIADSNESGSEIPKPADAFMPGFNQSKHGPKTGTQIATATKLPSSQASTVSEKADMSFIAIKGGKSDATTSLKDNVREAHAVVSATELRIMNDIFVFKDPRWEATARSGRVTEVTGSFTFRKAYVLGAPRTQAEALRDLKEFKKGLEDLLRPLGAKLELPQVIVEDNRVSVTPMTFKLQDPPFGKDLFLPFLTNIQPLREQFVKDELAKDCKNEVNLMMGDLILGVLSGSGSVEIHAGGVDAWTDDTDFTVPEFEPLGPSVEIPAVPEVKGTEAVPAEDYSYEVPGEYVEGTDGYDYDGFDSSGDENTVDTTTDATPVKKVTKKKTKTKKVQTKPTATRSDLAGSKSGTAAVAVGVAGLLGAIGMSMSEHLRERRTRRRIP